MIARRTIRIRLGGIAALCVAATFVAVTMLSAATGDTIADRELGEPDFLHSAAVNVNGVSLGTGNGYGLSGSTALAIDNAGHLYAADTANNRVLGWHSEAALVTGQPADLVVGQIDLYSVLANSNGSSNANFTNLSSPSGVAVDSKGNLYVSDTGNGRVLEYNAPYAACGGVFPCTVGQANMVFGQRNDFHSGGCNFGATTEGASADSLCVPEGLAVDSHDNLYIADQQNNRVLEFNTPLTVTAVPGSGDNTADFVFGQGASGTNFNTSAISCPSVSATSLCQPYGVAVDSNDNVYVSDTFERCSRAAREIPACGSLPCVDSADATVVIGIQGTSTANCAGTPSAMTLCGPGSVRRRGSAKPANRRR